MTHPCLRANGHCCPRRPPRRVRTGRHAARCSSFRVAVRRRSHETDLDWGRDHLGRHAADRTRRPHPAAPAHRHHRHAAQRCLATCAGASPRAGRGSGCGARVQTGRPCAARSAAGPSPPHPPYPPPPPPSAQTTRHRGPAARLLRRVMAYRHRRHRAARLRLVRCRRVQMDACAVDLEGRGWRSRCASRRTCPGSRGWCAPPCR
mmetsp:Transcript_16112/g.27803  ORF Transcript_16112/g.27803 Transcript_16112/m.27803 type:complete len:205 (+) Transcript_16112:955-1569(+)